MQRLLRVIVIVLSLCCYLNANAQTNQIVANGTATTSVTFPAGCVYYWVNSTPGIGFAASGTGNIASFNAVNTGSSTVTATITATPSATPLAYIGGPGIISVINTLTNIITAEVQIDVNGSAVYGVSVSPDGGRVYVSNGYTVAVINTATNALIFTIPLTGTAQGICLSPDGKVLYATSAEKGDIEVFNTTTYALITDIPVGTTPTAMIRSPDGSRVYVTNNGDGTVSVINTATNSIAATVTLNATPRQIAISPDGSKVYITNGSGNISVINTATNTLLPPIAVGGESIVVSRDGSYIYVDDIGLISKISTTTNTVTATFVTLQYSFNLG